MILAKLLAKYRAPCKPNSLPSVKPKHTVSLARRILLAASKPQPPNPRCRLHRTLGPPHRCEPNPERGTGSGLTGRNKPRTGVGPTRMLAFQPDFELREHISLSLYPPENPPPEERFHKRTHVIHGAAKAVRNASKMPSMTHPPYQDRKIRRGNLQSDAPQTWTR